ncbi:tryptophan-rich sensory protein [Blastococcus sp. SYSU DS0539]
MSLRTRLLAAAGPAAAAVVGALATDPGSRWFRSLDKPSWYPPPQAFGIVWTGLYAGLAWASGDGSAAPRISPWGRVLGR